MVKSGKKQWDTIHGMTNGYRLAIGSFSGKLKKP